MKDGQVKKKFIKNDDNIQGVGIELEKNIHKFNLSSNKPLIDNYDRAYGRLNNLEKINNNNQDNTGNHNNLSPIGNNLDINVNSGADKNNTPKENKPNGDQNNKISENDSQSSKSKNNQSNDNNAKDNFDVYEDVMRDFKKINNIDGGKTNKPFYNDDYQQDVNIENPSHRQLNPNKDQIDAYIENNDLYKGLDIEQRASMDYKMIC